MGLATSGWPNFSPGSQADPMLHNIFNSHGEYPTFLRDRHSEKSMGTHSPIHTLARIVCSQQSQS